MSYPLIDIKVTDLRGKVERRVFKAADGVSASSPDAPEEMAALVDEAILWLEGFYPLED